MQSDWLPYFWDFKSEKADVRKEQNLTPKTVYVRNPCCLYGSCYESRYEFGRSGIEKNLRSKIVDTTPRAVLNYATGK